MAEQSKTVLIIGATGVFGRRLATHLSEHHQDLNLILTSRNADRAETLAQHLRQQNDGESNRTVIGVAFDRADDVAGFLSAHQPWAVVDCTGPFQRADYHLAEAAINQGCHVIDLADASDYLESYHPALDKRARAQGVVAIAGASSTPALSGAVIAKLTAGWQQVQDLQIAITPGGRSEVGQAVIEAVLSYAGQPVTIWQRGKRDQALGWRDGQMMTIPGLGRRRVALVETADATLWGQRCWVEGDVRFYAGLESRLEQYGLEALAWLRARDWLSKWMSNPERLAPWLKKARRGTRLFTSNRGGMVVRATGRDRLGQARTARWSLVADQDHGPNVPVMAAIASLEKLANAPPKPGAYLAHEVLSLSDIEAPMASYAIVTKTERDVDLDVEPEAA
ncbi:MAG: saccharopine dehydrogenase NADP-binding domain-containing protein [Pseudomonadota bacterium]